MSDDNFDILDSIADTAAAREAAGRDPMLFDLGDDLLEYAADLGRREFRAALELRRQMDERLQSSG